MNYRIFYYVQLACISILAVLLLAMLAAAVSTGSPQIYAYCSFVGLLVCLALIGARIAYKDMRGGRK